MGGDWENGGHSALQCVSTDQLRIHGIMRADIVFLKENEEKAGDGSSGCNQRWRLPLLEDSRSLATPPSTFENVYSRDILSMH